MTFCHKPAMSQKKWRERRDLTEAQRADEPERSDGNPHKKSRFLRHAESNTAKIKKLKSKFTCALKFYDFCSDFLKTARKKDKKMARETGLEPATSTVTGWHSNQLSYSPAFI